MDLTGTWNFLAIEGAEVRLKSSNSGLMGLDVKAPVRSGTLHVVGAEATINLVLALDKIKTGNFLTEAAAKAFFKSHDAHDLIYNGKGPLTGSGYVVTGSAAAGSLDLSIDLTISAVGSATHPEVLLSGSASFGEVDIPMPGVGTVDNLQISVDASLAIASQS